MLRPTRRKLEPFDEAAHIDRLVEAYREAFEAILRTIVSAEQRGSPAKFWRDRLLNVYRILGELDAWTDDWIEFVIGQVYSEAALQTRSYLTTVWEGKPARPEFAKVHQRAVDVIAQNVQMNLRGATQYVGRRVHDVFRQVGVLEAERKFAAGRTLEQMKDEMVKKLLDQGKTCFIDRAGRKWSLERYAAMVARTTTRETATVATLNECKEFGLDLVQITEHKGSCEVCAPLQGRVYSISGKDRRYPKLLPEYTPPIHPNCRHVLLPYIRELDPDAEEMERRSKAPMTAPAAKPQLVVEEPKEKGPLKVENVEVIGTGISKTYSGVINGKKYVFKENAPLPGVGLKTGNLEAEVLASKIFRRLGVWCPEADYVEVDLGPNMGGPRKMLRVEFVSGVKTPEAFIVAAAGYDTIDRAAFRRMQVVDVLIANIDRHAGNFFFTPDGKPVPIDHNLAFVTGTVAESSTAWSVAFVDHVPMEPWLRGPGIARRSSMGEWVADHSTKQDYLDIIKAVQQSLTDAEIDKMVSELPNDLASKDRKEELAFILKWRRDNLDKLMEGLW